MLVIARQAGESIFVRDSPEGCLITVVEIGRDAATIQTNANPTVQPKKRDRWPRTLVVDETARPSETTTITIVDIRGEKVRLGIDVPNHVAVHRLEVWEAIQRENRAARKYLYDIDEDGSAGSPVPRPTGPTPSPLNVRLDEPSE